LRNLDGTGQKGFQWLFFPFFFFFILWLVLASEGWTTAVTEEGANVDVAT
jgi:hypothetical protein